MRRFDTNNWQHSEKVVWPSGGRARLLQEWCAHDWAFMMDCRYIQPWLDLYHASTAMPDLFRVKERSSVNESTRTIGNIPRCKLFLIFSLVHPEVRLWILKVSVWILICNFIGILSFFMSICKAYFIILYLILVDCMWSKKHQWMRLHLRGICRVERGGVMNVLLSWRG